MSTSWDWPGSRWWRVDLHAHSPSSYDYKPASERDGKDWPAWLRAASDALLEAVAVTDHNTAVGLQPILDAAGGITNPPVILPGIEITASDGTHLLLVLDPSRSQRHVEAILAGAKIAVDRQGHQEARSRLSVEDLLDVASGGAIVLAAHGNGPNGLLNHDGQQRIAELKDSRLHGVEIDPDHPVDESWLDGSKPEIGRPVPHIWASDSHSRTEAGRRFTWIKMSQPNLEGLRLALLDGEDSLKPSTYENPGDPNRHASYVIEAITVSKARYMGRDVLLKIAFNPWLNAIIGGRGTGKSTLVDFLRKTFRRESELTGGDGESLRATFDRRMRVPPDRQHEGLLTPDTTVEVTYRKDDARFVLAWDTTGRSSPIVRVEEGSPPVPEQGDIRERFPVRIYSQKQLFDLAQDPNALLSVIDDTAVVRGSERARARSEAETRYLSICADARALRVRAAALPDLQAQLTDIRRKLQVLEQSGQAKTFSDYRARRRQHDAWVSIRQAISESVEALVANADLLVVADLDVALDPDADPAATALMRTHARLRETVASLRAAVLAQVDEARAKIAGLDQSPDGLAWSQAVAATEQAYQRIAEELRVAGITDPGEYRDLLQRAASLEAEIGTLEGSLRTADERDKEAAETLRRYRELRDDLAGQRIAFADSASNPLVKVEVGRYARTDSLEPVLRDSLGIERFDEDRAALAARIRPAAQQSWSFQRLDDTVAALRRVLADPDLHWPARDHRFVAALRRVKPEQIDRLALYLPDDAVDVSFSDPRTRSASWRPLSQGSPGQRTAALLAFVLGYGNEPIILDQPEDDLDSTLIYELVVQRLRETKPTRQVIVVTHNPNIVVHGDAELVISMDAGKGQTEVAVSGGLQEEKTRDEVCRVMEGGRDAFENRYRRIMHPGERI